MGLISLSQRGARRPRPGRLPFGDVISPPIISEAVTLSRYISIGKAARIQKSLH